MPTYAYACTACDEQIEVVQRFTDAPLTDCPACSGRLRKVFTPVGIVFKGSGFYKTDARSSGRSSSASPAAEKKDAAGSSSGSSGGPAAPGSESSGSSASSGSPGSSGSASSSSTPSAAAS